MFVKNCEITTLPNYILCTMPLFGYISFGTIQLYSIWAYNFFVLNKKLYDTDVNFKTLNNRSAYAGFIVGVLFVYRGKPLLCS